ncbi:hypothetical protein OJF2_63230 [Aquisphaera giovannonii]|uniref:SGNH hydrolase-type esterase domain-containing protein n=1 Tax=Aquisphaera giovannonii TaxID=406548 RepID=A0A5B9WB06_9BACT|nr:SGNH/GDSL hydrolase family protein [Aquisphaera giovannonii]QEH37732.1 hypothetical protein OJF2_63230 [Aquisphaera giovannonii]
MASTKPVSIWTVRMIFLQGVALLAIALIPLPAGWTRLRAAVDSARSPELNRAEREAHAAGYYEGLIGGGDSSEGARGELNLLLMGKPSGWVRFSDANVSRSLPGDFLQFELLPDVRRVLFGQPFVTNSHGMHGPDVAAEKPPGTFRIALLGASMDMGWGVTYQETYAHRLERWLNNHGTRRGDATGRRFEVLNFAVAAYSPLQRLDTLRRKALAFRPDLVIFSATMLDLRLMEIHLCDALRTRSDLTYDFVRDVLSEAGVTADEMAVEGDKLVYKDAIKEKIQPRYWDLYDRTLGRLAAECRAAGVPALMVIVPRVGKADAPAARAEPVARLKALAAHNAMPVYDLTGSFDRFDPASLEIAAWDDHPNALGHRRLFLALARSLADDPERYRLLFPGADAPPAPQGPAATDDFIDK